MQRAVYPGTFDPVTNGYLDLIKRSLVMFDEVVVAVTDHSAKKTLFNLEERLALVKSAVKGWRGVRVEPFSGLLVAYAKKRNCCAIIRGLRAVADFEYEFQMALMNRHLSPTLETIYLMPSEVYTYVSSTIIKEVAGLGGRVDAFVPVSVKRALQERL